MTGFLLTAKQKLMLCINKRLYRSHRPNGTDRNNWSNGTDRSDWSDREQRGSWGDRCYRGCGYTSGRFGDHRTA